MKMPKQKHSPVKQAMLDELDLKKKEMDRVFTRDELVSDPEYALIRRLRRWVEALPEPAPKKPFVLVTVSRGIASVWCPKGVEYDIIDWDNYAQDLPTREELVRLRKIAGRVQHKDDRKMLLSQIQELEDRGVADED